MTRAAINPMHPSWPVAGLSMLHFGGAGVALALWSAWSLGWLSLAVALNSMVLAGLGMAVFYGFCAVRFYRGTNPPDFTHLQKGVCMLAWFLLTVIAFRRLGNAGVISGAAGLIALVYAFFAFLSLAMCGKDRRRMALCGVNVVLGVFGWGVMALQLLRIMELYFLGGLPDMPAILPVTLANFIDRQDQLLGINGVLVLAIGMVAAAFCLRVAAYWSMMKVPWRGLFGKCACGSLLFLVAAFAFSQVARMHLAGQFAATEEIFQQRQSAVMGQYPDAGGGDGRAVAGFIRQMEESGARWYQVVAASLKKDKSPKFNWYESARLRWIPAPSDNPAALAELRGYASQFASQFQEFDRLLATMPPAFGGWPEWLKRITAWRLQYGIQIGDWANAVRLFRQLDAMVVDNGAMPLDRVAFSHDDSLWLDLAQIMLESPQCPEEALSEIAGAIARFRAGEEKYRRLRRAQMASGLCVGARFVDGTGMIDLRKCAWIMPVLSMTAYADAAEAMRFAVCADEVWPERLRGNAPMASILASIFHRAIGRRQLLESKMNMLELQIAAERHARRTGGYPLTLTALVPEFIAALPVDPQAPELPYSLTCDEGQVWSWNYTAAAAASAAVHRLRIASATGEVSRIVRASSRPRRE